MRCSMAPRHLKHVPAVGGVCPELPGVLVFRRPPPSWRPWATNPPCLITRRRRCQSFGPRTASAMPESPAAGACIPSALIPLLSVPGKPAAGSCTTLPPGSAALAIGKGSSSSGYCRKLAPQFVGPFEVDQMVNPVAVRLRLPLSMKVHSTFHVPRVRPVVDSDLSPPADDPPPVRIVDVAPVYTVREILKVHRRGQGYQYLMDWEGYGPGCPAVTAQAVRSFGLPALTLAWTLSLDYFLFGLFLCGLLSFWTISPL